MTGWILDTNILSELRRQRPEPRVLAFVAAQPLDRLYVSTVTFADIRFGIERVSDPHQRAVLHEWLMNKVRPMFDQRVLPITEDVMYRWRLMVEEGHKANHTSTQPDLIIAATAAHHGLSVVIRDTGDYERTRVPLFNPWVDPPPQSKPPTTN